MKVMKIKLIFAVLATLVIAQTAIAQQYRPQQATDVDAKPVAAPAKPLSEVDLIPFDSGYQDITPFEPEEVEEKVRIAEATDKSDVQYTLGQMYQNGYNVERNYKKAEYWYLKPAKRNHIPSMIALGKLYKMAEPELGLARNPNKAFSWFSKAAKLGSAYAWYELGVLYENGDGVFQNYKSAFNSYKSAADGGFLQAHAKLGMCYQKGMGVKKDIKAAIKHYTILAREAKNENVQNQVNKILGGVYGELANQQKSEEDKAKLLEEAARLGDEKSQILLADMYREGTGVLRDYTKAIDLYKRGAAQDNTYAMENLGYIYSNGLGVDRNYDEALKWYKLAAERGSAQGAWNIGNFYLNGFGVAPNQAEANKWFDRANKAASINTN